MTLQQIIHNLHLYQKWRRGGKIPMPNPKELGETLDEVIRLLRKMKKEDTVQVHFDTECKSVDI